MRKLAGAAVALREEPAEAFLAELRRGSPPVVALLRDGRVLLDVRCVTDLTELAAAVASARERAARPQIAKLGGGNRGVTQLPAGRRAEADSLEEGEV